MADASSPAPLRVALAGYGVAGASFHAPLIAATDGLVLQAVVTRDPARRAQLAARHPGVVAADALADVVGGVDVVVVAAPNRFHADLARMALEAGKHVVVEKPLAVTSAQARALAVQAATAGVVLAAFHNRRWDDDFLTLRRVLDEGRLGRVLRLESRFDRWRPQIKAGAWREEGDPPTAAGCCSTSAATSSIRPCNCWDRCGPCTRSSTCGARARWWRTTSSLRWRTRAARARTSGRASTPPTLRRACGPWASRRRSCRSVWIRRRRRCAAARRRGIQDSVCASPGWRRRCTTARAAWGSG